MLHLLISLTYFTMQFLKKLQHTSTPINHSHTKPLSETGYMINILHQKQRKTLKNRWETDFYHSQSFHFQIFDHNSSIHLLFFLKDQHKQISSQIAE